MHFNKGDRVMTPQGPGRVVYKRYRAPDYIEVEVYSVILDSKLAESMANPFSFYGATIYKAEEVQAFQY